MNKTIKEWQQAAYELADKTGSHHKECTHPCEVRSDIGYCKRCNFSNRYSINLHSPMVIAARLERIHAKISDAGNCVARRNLKLFWLAPDGTVAPCAGYVSSTGEIHATSAAFTPQQQLSYQNFLRSQGYKPEGFGIELAGVFLHLCDFAESLQIELELPDDKSLCGWKQLHEIDEICSEILGLHKRLSLFDIPTDLSRPLTSQVGDLDTFLELLLRLAHRTSVDLFAMAELKLQYEKSKK